MNKYVEERGGGYYVAGTRVGLECVLYCLRDGYTPEKILDSFPALESVEVVNGVIAFCLANQELVDDYLRDLDRILQEMADEQARCDDPLLKKLRQAKAERLLKQT